MRIAVAESLGWVSKMVPSNEEMEDARLGRGAYKGMAGCPVGGGPLGGMQFLHWMSPSGERVAPPNFPSDLNAMHGVEKDLENAGWLCSYLRQLHLVCNGRELLMQGSTSLCNPLSFKQLAELIHATAAQRCEAYLRVKGLWKE